jgi:hypothetical protein
MQGIHAGIFQVTLQHKIQFIFGCGWLVAAAQTDITTLVPLLTANLANRNTYQA